MTEAEYILADLVINKFPIHEPFTLDRVYNKILDWKHDQYSQTTLDELYNLINTQNPAIITFLLDNGYILVSEPRHPRYSVTEPGKKAKELGGHKQYLAWKEKEDKAKQRQNIPTKYWLVILVFTSILSPILVNKLTENKQVETTQQDKKIQALRDSVQLLLDRPKETLYIQPNPLSQSKIDTTKTK